MQLVNQSEGLTFNPLRKHIFQRFLGRMTALAEEQPFYVLEVSVAYQYLRRTRNNSGSMRELLAFQQNVP